MSKEIIYDLLWKARVMCSEYIAENGTDNLDMIELEDKLDELMNTYC